MHWDEVRVGIFHRDQVSFFSKGYDSFASSWEFNFFSMWDCSWQSMFEKESQLLFLCARSISNKYMQNGAILWCIHLKGFQLNEYGLMKLFGGMLYWNCKCFFFQAHGSSNFWCAIGGRNIAIIFVPISVIISLFVNCLIHEQIIELHYFNGKSVSQSVHVREIAKI